MISLGSRTEHSEPRYANYLPDELLLEVLHYITQDTASQPTLASFCRVSWQWYNVGIRKLYEAPVLVGSSYDLFVRTVCPSLNAHIKKSDLAGLGIIPPSLTSPLASLTQPVVKVLDLSVIVHQGNKATTARLLNRTKPSLERFAAPQASFGINCWAALTKCTKLRILDLSLISESIDYASLVHTVPRLPQLRKLYFPRCSCRYDVGKAEDHAFIPWPPHMQHLQISGGLHMRLIQNFMSYPPPISSLGISHIISKMGRITDIQFLVKSLTSTLTTLELRDIPSLAQDDLDLVLEWAPNLRNLTIAIDYISIHFCTFHLSDLSQKYPAPADKWQRARPLERLKLVSCGKQDYDIPQFTWLDLLDLLEERYLGRVRYIDIERATGWEERDEGESQEVLQEMEAMDRESWEARRWHYEGYEGLYKTISWSEWIGTKEGARFRPWVRYVDY